MEVYMEQDEKNIVHLEKQDINLKKEVQQKETNIIVHIILWCLGICFLFFVCAMISIGDFLSGIVWLAAGLLLCSKIKINMKVKYGAVSAIVLFLIGCALMEEDGSEQVAEEQAVQEDQNVDEQASPAENDEKQKKSNEPVKKHKEDTKKEENAVKESDETKDKEDLEKIDKSDSKKEKKKVKKEKLKCSFNFITKSIEKYKYYKNPYYIEGLKKYVEGLNSIYDDCNMEQKVEVADLDDILDEVGISSKLQQKIFKNEGHNILKESDFVRVDTEVDDSFFSELFNGELQRTYYEVSSLAKDDFMEDETVCFYLGELKDNMPEGEGAVFKLTEYGARPFYIGEFHKGQYSGYGISLLNSEFANIISDIGYYKKNQRNGEGVSYNVKDIEGIYNFYKNEFAKYAEDYLLNYSVKKQNKKMNALLDHSFLAELFVTVKQESDIKPYKIRVKYPVIRPLIKYKGEQKEGRYHGEGKLYHDLGMLWYQGGFYDGEFNGNGTLYYAATDQIKYEGRFNSGNMDGKGTLYNEDGSIRKQGDFDKEELGSEDEFMQFCSIITFVDDLYNEVGEKEFFEGKTDVIKETDRNSDDGEEVSDYICPNSSAKKLTKKQVLKLSKKKRWLAKNEIYARHGRKFNNQELQDYFNSTTWYIGTIEPEDFDESVFNKVEKANIKLLTQYE